ncbi:amino acid ABC transporter ATP-binding protein [Jeotgalibaca ciconiae]|uniref:Amino acid ABC transporter ATP-binding protein n=1 Tax=Jeotgalibaca ciconiae TaxID=2496265 RepID=A0A3Q9BLQ2_9LACT|nr:ATP-binding cassette domain-containing protein [Jeotgalibaca ciconiae]AZP05127.1 amino acid ABC transporter ATP-binding protein [Jeotgalibaca ciconiae]HJB23234.1 ATP-binding cassette domain-containing protein [Candidatus Jeotgalibaca pullicola]
MLLQAKNITKKFQNQPVLKNFSFSIDAGEIVVLTGKSGTGKTTLMRILNNLESADYGTVAIENDYLCRDSERGAAYVSRKERRVYQNQIGMVFQDYALFPNLTVRENLLEAPLAQKLGTKEELNQKVEQLMNEMGIADQLDKMPSMLSGGQKQRVAIARAMMLNPKILCFDEPTSALDRESADSIGKLIQEIAARGTGVLIVTHDISFGEKFGTRLISSSEFFSK